MPKKRKQKATSNKNKSERQKRLKQGKDDNFKFVKNPTGVQGRLNLYMGKIDEILEAAAILYPQEQCLKRWKNYI